MLWITLNIHRQTRFVTVNDVSRVTTDCRMSNRILFDIICMPRAENVQYILFVFRPRAEDAPTARWRFSNTTGRANGWWRCAWFATASSARRRPRSSAVCTCPRTDSTGTWPWPRIADGPASSGCGASKTRRNRSRTRRRTWSAWPKRWWTVTRPAANVTDRNAW